MHFLRNRKISVRLAVLAGLVLSILVREDLARAQGPGQGQTQSFNQFAVEANGVKFWLPSTLVVKKGDTVKIHAISKIGGKNNIHGLAIDAFKVEALVDDKGKDIEFVADKAGIYPIRCHLHPAHVGGQLLVTE